jgi:hypothetical protein
MILVGEIRGKRQLVKPKYGWEYAYVIMGLERKRKRKDVDWINLPLLRVRGGIVPHNTANILSS